MVRDQTRDPRFGQVRPGMAGFGRVVAWLRYGYYPCVRLHINHRGLRPGAEWSGWVALGLAWRPVCEITFNQTGLSPGKVRLGSAVPGVAVHGLGMEDKALSEDSERALLLTAPHHT